MDNTYIDIIEQAKQTLLLLQALRLEFKDKQKGTRFKLLESAYIKKIMFLKQKFEKLGISVGIIEVQFGEYDNLKMYFTNVSLEIAQILFKVYAPNERTATFKFIQPGKIIFPENSGKLGN